MNEPLEYLSRKELQLNIMQNIEKEITYLSKNNRFRNWWENTPNWGRVQRIINGGTVKGGSTSSVEQCLFLGVDPDGHTFLMEVGGEQV